MFFLVIAGNAASSTDPVKMTLSNLDEIPIIELIITIMIKLHIKKNF